jgi:hypothetical protein
MTGTSILVMSLVLSGEGAPEEVRPFVDWFPADTETLVVGESFSVPTAASRPQTSLNAGLFLRGLQHVVDLEPIEGVRVRVALQGARDFEVIGKWGLMRDDSCSIVVFEESLGDHWQPVERSLRSKATSVRRLRGVDVYRVPLPIASEGERRRERTALHVARARDDILLIASKPEFLAEVIGRARDHDEQRERPFADELPEWAYIDREARFWGLRQIPASLPRTFFRGLTLAESEKGLEVVYIDTRNRAERIVRWVWELRRKNPEDVVRVKTDGDTVRVVVSKKVLDEGSADRMLYGLFLYRALGDDGTMCQGEENIPEKFRPRDGVQPDDRE